MIAPPDWPDPVFVFDFSGPWPNNGSGHYPGTFNVYGWCYVDAWDHPTISGQYVTGVEYHYYYNGGYAIGTKSCTNVTCRHPSHGMESTEQWEYPETLQVAWHSAPNPPCINTIDYSYSPTMDLPSGNIPQDLINWFDASQPIYRAWAASNNYAGQYLDNSLTDLFNNSNCSRSRYGSNMSSYHDDCLMYTDSYGTVRVKDIRTGVLTGGTCTWSNDGSTLTWKRTAKTLNTGNSSDRTLLGSIPSYNNLNDEGLNLFNNKIDAYMINHYAAQIETYFNNVDLNSVTRGSNGNIYVESNSTYITAISALSSNNSNCPNV